MLTSLQMAFVARLEEVHTFGEGAGPSYWPGDAASKVVPLSQVLHKISVRPSQISLPSSHIAKRHTLV